MKEKGILLPIFSLPSKYGIGDFGKEAYEFIDILYENGMASTEMGYSQSQERNGSTIGCNNRYQYP